MWNVLLAQAQEAAEQVMEQGPVDALAEGAARGPAPNPLMQMLPMLLIFGAIMYFFMIRPNQKREKERREMLASLSKGDKVVTSGGICGSIVGLTDKTVVLRVGEDRNMKMEFLRGAISQVTARDGQD